MPRLNINEISNAHLQNLISLSEVLVRRIIMSMMNEIIPIYEFRSSGSVTPVAYGAFQFPRGVVYEEMSSGCNGLLIASCKLAPVPLSVKGRLCA